MATLFDSIRIASPCSADWENMIGNERRRFCGQCDLNVYDLSEMTRHEAEQLIAQTEGRLCARFYRRADGTILTRDCPVGLQAVRRRLSKIRHAVVSSVLGFLAGVGFFEFAREVKRPVTMGTIEAQMGSVAGTPPFDDTEASVVTGAVTPLRKTVPNRQRRKK